MPGHVRLIRMSRFTKDSGQAESALPVTASACLEGFRLFNAGKYFDCHEALEPLWLAASGEQRVFLHALIQVAAAMHHWQHHNEKGARSLYQRAREKLLSLPPWMMGISIRDFTAKMDLFLNISPATVKAATISCAIPPQIQMENVE